MAFTVCRGLGGIVEGYKNLQSIMSWAVSLGSDTLISHRKVADIQQRDFIYPIHIEKDTIETLCARNNINITELADSFFDKFNEGIYSPDAIKKSVIRYLLAVLAVVKEVNFGAYKRIDESEIVRAVTNAVTRKEIQDIVYEMLETAMQRGHLSGSERQNSEKTFSLVLQKALRMVEEFYMNGITLTEVALALNITPEHISSLFTKELGINFSTYIKDFRLKKAKELLLGTNLKLYEVAEQTGYSDAKYFSRVFKEEQGVLPAEYRKIHK
jgi:two-component system response regulator YesN